MTRMLFALFVLASAPIASAQTVSMIIDRFAYPELELAENPPIPYDLDGNPLTREWVQSRYNKLGRYELRGLALRSSGVCAGTWFQPFAAAEAQALPLDMIWVGFIAGPTGEGKHRFVAFGIRGQYEITISYGC